MANKVIITRCRVPWLEASQTSLWANSRMYLPMGTLQKKTSLYHRHAHAAGVARQPEELARVESRDVRANKRDGDEKGYALLDGEVGCGSGCFAAKVRLKCRCNIGIEDWLTILAIFVCTRCRHSSRFIHELFLSAILSQGRAE